MTVTPISEDDQKRLSEAFQYAVELHATQPRKGSDIPYVAHLMAVSALVLEHGGTVNQAIAALLHDGPEDQGGEATLDEIRDRFGDEVADVVTECSDTFEDPKPPWKPRKKAYLRHLKKASDGAALVSLADKTHNLTAILRDHETNGDALWERFNGSKKDIRWYYRRLRRVYNKRIDSEAAQPLLREYRRLVKRLRRV